MLQETTTNNTEMTMNITTQEIQQAIQSKRPTSLASLWAALGNKSKPGQSARAAIMAAMPNVIEELNQIKAHVAGQTPVAKPQKAPKPQKPVEQKANGKSEWLKGYSGKSEGNPYGRKGSSYAAIWDSVKRNPGKTKEWHLARLSPLTGKSEQKLGFDFGVVIKTALDAKSKKAIGSKSKNRHRSCKSGYTAGAKVSNGEKVFWIN